MLRHLTGDCRDVLKTLEDESVNCVVTSPPYWGLRSYGIGADKGEIGLEPTPELYVRNMVDVFREVRRVLRKDGNCWINLGDSFFGSGKGLNGDGTSHDTEGRKQKTNAGSIELPKTKHPSSYLLKPKDLVGIPWRVAFALQADGWYLRQDIIWHKPNPMPESVTDRCTKAHEYIFLLSKKAKYYYDAEAIKEISISPPRAREKNNGESVVETKARGYDSSCGNDGTRNKRSVWTVIPQPFSGMHFAVYPPNLIRPCILAGCPAGGWILDPFGGSGTTGLVAEQEGRNAILIELNPDYVELAKKRTQQTSLLTDG